ncbi:MAG TPA: hypothetical protein DCQ58_07395 [Saprospirales bacterium]|nr:hypothetical protein [Saprospirales bacterium]
MKWTKVLFVGVLTGIFAFFFGWLVFGVLMPGSMEYGVEGFARAEDGMVWWAMILSNILWGLLLAYIFIRWASISTWWTGFKAALVIGFLVTAAFDAGLYSMTNMFESLTAFLMDVLINTVYTAILGAFAGWLAGKNWV